METIFGPSSTPPPPNVLNQPASPRKQTTVEDNMLVIHINSAQPFVAKHLLPPPDVNSCSYKITVETGDDKSASTDSNVFVKLIGSRTTSKWVQLCRKNSCHGPEKELFESGNVDDFLINVPYCGDILEIATGIDLSGQEHPGWLLSGINISETWPNAKTVWTFPVTKWLEADFDLSRHDFYVRHALKQVSPIGVFEESYNMSVLSSLVNENFCLVNYVLREWGFEGIKMFGWNTSSHSPNQAFVANKNMQTYLVFRGAEPLNPTDWVSGFNAQALLIDKFGIINSGFWQGIGLDTINSIGPEIFTHLEKLGLGNNLHIAGHSIAGALASTFATLLVQKGKTSWVKSVNTFGMPKFGDAKLMETLSTAYHGKFHRFVYGNDLVARIPADKPCGWMKEVSHVFVEGPGTCTYLNPVNGEIQICISTPELISNPSGNEIAEWLSAHSIAHYCDGLKNPIINYF